MTEEKGPRREDRRTLLFTVYARVQSSHTRYRIIAAEVKTGKRP